MTYYCDQCGGVLEHTEGTEYYCESCNCWYDISDDQLQYYTDPEAYLCETDEIHEEFEQGCMACGNTAYPECKASCPLFDY